MKLDFMVIIEMFQIWRYRKMLRIRTGKITNEEVVKILEEKFMGHLLRHRLSNIVIEATKQGKNLQGVARTTMYEANHARQLRNNWKGKQRKYLN